VSTGRSKGGVSAFIHKRYFPQDVDATVAKVAPIMLSTADYRLEEFLNQVGTEQCRENIHDFQRLVLQKRKELKPFFEALASKYKLEFNTLGYDGALEFAVSEFEFYFWQFGPHPCADIPNEKTFPEDIFKYFSKKTWIGSYADSDIITYGNPITYQLYTQMGYYRLVTDHFHDLLTVDKSPSYRDFLPKDVSFKYDIEPMKDIAKWLETKGNNMIYLYGSIDPYIAASVKLSDQVDALKIIQKNAGHRFLLQKLDDKELVYQKLEEWLGVTIKR
jgi:PS-10 peptidase S37